MTVLYKNKPLEVPEGTAYLELAKRFAADYDAPIILAKLGQRLVELNREISILKDAPGRAPGNPPVLEFITTKTRDGSRTYERGATMMLLRAMRHVFGETLSSMKLEYAIGDGLYFTVNFIKDGEACRSGAFLTDENLAEVRPTTKSSSSSSSQPTK